MKCLFFEVTGRTTCPFHVIRYEPLMDFKGCVYHIGVAYKRSKPKRKVIGRMYGKSR